MKYLSLLLFLPILIFCLFYYTFHSEHINQPGLSTGSPLYQFIAKHFLDPSGGVYTNLKNNHPETPGTVQNHVFLTESTGLLLNYAAKERNKELYEQQLEFTKKYLVTKYDLLRWFYDSEGKQIAESNATIDDLRVIRGLLLGYDQWKNEDDLKLGLKLAEGVRKWDIKEGCLVDFYNWNTQKQAKQMTISYLDLYTMKHLESYNPFWKKIYDQSLSLIQRASLGNGLYRKTFDYSKNDWAEQANVNLIDSFYSTLHLAEVGEDPKETIAFIQEKWRLDGKLYSVYSLEGTPVEKFESPAVYGLAIRILEAAKKPELIPDLVKRLNKLQVQDQSSPFYGGYVDLETEDAFSFDQLQVLLSESEAHF